MVDDFSSLLIVVLVVVLFEVEVFVDFEVDVLFEFCLLKFLLGVFVLNLLFILFDVLLGFVVGIDLVCVMDVVVIV